MLLIENDIIERIAGISWFSNCGNQIKSQLKFEIGYAVHLKKAVKHAENQYWERFRLEAKNELTASLCIAFPDKYIKWNKYTKEAREIIEIYVVPSVLCYIKRNRLNVSFLDDVKWDILCAIMEYTYRNEMEPLFFMELLKVYESGNFPCG